MINSLENVLAWKQLSLGGVVIKAQVNQQIHVIP